MKKEDGRRKKRKDRPRANQLGPVKKNPFGPVKNRGGEKGVRERDLGPSLRVHNTKEKTTRSPEVNTPQGGKKLH